MNSYLLALDVSTKNVGIALFDNQNGDLIELKHLLLKVSRDISPEDRYIYKANLFKEYIEYYKEYVENDLNGQIVDISIEAPLSNTPKNINTTALLLGFNGIISYKIYEIFNIIPIKISVHDTRKLFCPEFINLKKEKGKLKETLSFPKGWINTDKKEYIRKKVEHLHNDIEWHYTRNNTIKDTSHDMSDAYAVGFASLIVKNVIDYPKWKEASSKMELI